MPIRRGDRRVNQLISLIILSREEDVSFQTRPHRLAKRSPLPFRALDPTPGGLSWRDVSYNDGSKFRLNGATTYLIKDVITVYIMFRVIDIYIVLNSIFNICL